MAREAATRVETWSPVDALRLVMAAGVLLVLLLVDWLVGDAVLSFFSDVFAGFSTVEEDVVTASVFRDRRARFVQPPRALRVGLRLDF